MSLGKHSKEMVNRLHQYNMNGNKGPVQVAS